jgi:hypothetical protein
VVKPGKFVRKPFYVEAIQVTGDNLFEVAEWCGGRVLETPSKEGEKKSLFIKVNVVKPLNDRQTKAFAGDWVLKSGTTFKVYAQKAFLGTFDPVNNDLNVFSN